MELAIQSQTCATCDTKFTAIVAADGSYGQFLMYSKTGEAVALNAIEDRVFGEVDRIVSRHPISGRLGDVDRAAVLHAVFSVACDSDSSGHLYQIGAFAPCPGCGSQQMASWQPFAPVDAGRQVSSVTHRAWNEMATAEKREIVYEAIERDLADKD